MFGRQPDGYHRKIEIEGTERAPARALSCFSHTSYVSRRASDQTIKQDH